MELPDPIADMAFLDIDISNSSDVGGLFATVIICGADPTKPETIKPTGLPSAYTWDARYFLMEVLMQA
jgi:hypothetical protein